MTDVELADQLAAKGWGVTPPDRHLIDLPSEFCVLWEKVSPYTMTSIERGYALYNGVRYVCENNIPGDFVECGVWKGGSCMLIAYTLLSIGVQDRHIVLYDTFEGMTEPGEEDIIAWNNRSILERYREEGRSYCSWHAGLEEVRHNMASTGYPPDLCRYVAGDVVQTLRDNTPAHIALMRLDTDWYQSTFAEVNSLYPRLAKRGLCIVDDYGHFLGARKAVDEFLDSLEFTPYLARTDYTGRTFIKP